MIYSIFPKSDTTCYERYPTKNTGLDEILELEKIVSSSTIAGLHNTRILMDFGLYSLSQSLVASSITPDKFYVAFPYSVYPSQHLKKYRREISQRGNFFILNEIGNSVLDGEYCGFAFDADQVGKLTKYQKKD